MSFSADISRFISKTEKSIETGVRKISLELFSKVILKSPVDTGRFRANWYASINMPSSMVTTMVDKTGTDSIRKAGSVAQSYKIGDAAIYLTNNLPYAHRLETGYSGQAPQGMARLSVMEIASKYA